MNPLKIAIATSTRADWGLLSPLAKALRRAGADVRILATNMHLMPQMGLTVRYIEDDGFTPRRIPATGDAPEIAAQALAGFSAAFTEDRPDAVVILGDRYEMLAVAMAAALARVPIVHIAGGTVSEGAFDDAFRNAITKLASLHLTETDMCRRRIVQMGENHDYVVTTGAIGIHNILALEPIPAAELAADLGFAVDRDTYVVTLHPATLDPGDPHSQMQNLLTALAEHPELKYIITYPNNDVDPQPQIHLIEQFAAEHPQTVKAIPSLGQRRYLSALHYAGGVIGNSSSGIVEVPSFGIPTLDIGIRQKGRERAASVLNCEADAASISAGIDAIRSTELIDIAARRENPYHRPGTLRLMTEAIMQFPFSSLPQKKFHEIDFKL